MFGAFFNVAVRAVDFAGIVFRIDERA